MGFSCSSSYTEIPSLSQRGILLCVLLRVTTWQNSCQRTASQFEGSSPCEAGLFAVITLPKQTPSRPSAPGRPKVRTANSFFWGKISTITASGSVTSYFSQRLSCPAKQGQHALAVEIGLADIHPDHEPVVLERAKAVQAVVERDQVKGDHVVAVLGEDLAGELPPLGLVAQPEEGLAELDLGGQVLGVEVSARLWGRRPRRSDTSGTARGRSASRPPGSCPQCQGRLPGCGFALRVVPRCASTAR